MAKNPIAANGKLLLTGEYFVLDGARALATPVRFGQTLLTEKLENSDFLEWKSLDADGTTWFSAVFDLKNFTPLQSTDEKTAATLQTIFQKIRLQKPSFLTENQGFKIETRVNFPREWGLGTSSTLIAALARWAEVNPYPLLFQTLGGSGYDLACAFAGTPIFYRLKNQTPEIQPLTFAPAFSKNLFFVFLGKKQNSREGIERYRERAAGLTDLIPEISNLTEKTAAAKSLPEFDRAILDHEKLVARALDLPRAKDLFFSDFWGEVKSLGAWGGDFALVTSPRAEEETRRFFNEKGFDVFIPWREMVL